MTPVKPAKQRNLTKCIIELTTRKHVYLYGSREQSNKPLSRALANTEQSQLPHDTSVLLAARHVAMFLARKQRRPRSVHVAKQNEAVSTVSSIVLVATATAAAAGGAAFKLREETTTAATTPSARV